MSLVLSESATAILALAAAHDGVAPAQLVTRLVCQRAEAIGLAKLLDGARAEALTFARCATPSKGGGP